METSAPVRQPVERYRQELERVRAARALLERRSGVLATVRFAVFVVGVAFAALVVAQRGGAGQWGVIASAAAFVGLIVGHERILRQRDRADRSIRYLDRGLARLEDRWLEGGDDGARFADPDHLYAADLEIFGHGSLFHLLATTTTETGAGSLARWLKTAASAEEIASRQAAVKELAEKFELRHGLGVVAPAAGRAIDSGVLRQWLLETNLELPDWVGPAALALAVANVATIGFALGGVHPGFAVLLPLLATLSLGLWCRRSVARLLETADRPARELRVVATLLERLAGESFRSDRLARLTAELAARDQSPLVAIGALERLVNLADARRNQLFLPIASSLLLGTQVAWRIERWRRRAGNTAVRWLDAVGELEALASLAAFAHDHPGDAFPTITPDRTPVVARGLAHALLPTGRAVRNDLSLGGDVRLVMVSGSNMSGKSTLLKAIGTNLVLAFAGAPVRATSLTTPRLAIAASLVLRDSLLEGRSRFFAEVLRLKQVAALAAEGTPVLFLLDELLSGTNSHDRAIGARGVLTGLIERGAIGLVTTHDLALTSIAADLAPKAVNVHLEDRLVDGRLEFDYVLKSGVVTRSNALELMRAVGLEIRG